MQIPDESKAQEILGSVEGQLRKLRSICPTRLDLIASSKTSKLPGKATWFAGAVCWRMLELSQGALDDLGREHIASSILLSRAAIETSAALYSFNKKIEVAVASNSLGDIDEYLMRFLIGHKIDPQFPQAMNVLTCVQRVDRDIDGFLHHYNVVSEYAHPNWSGTAFLFSNPDRDQSTVAFGPNVRGGNSASVSALVGIDVALLVFLKTHNDLHVQLPDFVSLCEANIVSN